VGFWTVNGGKTNAGISGLTELRLVGNEDYGVGSYAKLFAVL